jgi:hypothetical protein
LKFFFGVELLVIGFKRGEGGKGEESQKSEEERVLGSELRWKF